MRYDPNKDHFIDNNVEAMRILVEANVLQKLTPPNPIQNSGYNCFDNGTHWCLGSYHRGFDEDKDNGYGVVMRSKNGVSKEEAAADFASIILSMEHDNLTVQPFVKEPQSNN